MQKPLLALTMGDPAGVGPEVVTAAGIDPDVLCCCRPIVCGHPQVLRRALATVGRRAAVIEIDAPATVDPGPDRLYCLPCCSDDTLDVPPGRVDPRGGRAAYDAVACATRLALDDRVEGVVTAALCKAALHAAGHVYPGHTELLADLCGAADVAMMLYRASDEVARGAAGLGVVHATLHMALRDVFAALSIESIAAKIRLGHEALSAIKGSPARVAVAALNPHAGEAGVFGDEEQTVIRPAVERAVTEGIDVVGPLPADSLLPRALEGEFDAVIVMYHDQGHVAMKALGMHRVVNVTLGLPIVRTSVAHGTAFDLAWQGRAEIGSMVEAVRTAAMLAGRRRARLTASTQQLDR